MSTLPTENPLQVVRDGRLRMTYRAGWVAAYMEHQKPLWRNFRGTPLLQIGANHIGVPKIVWATMSKAFVLLDISFTSYIRAEGVTRSISLRMFHDKSTLQ